MRLPIYQIMKPKPLALCTPTPPHTHTPGDVVCSVLPKTGMALLFNHDTLHEGKPVTMGTKYIIRTEVMYRRVDSEMIPNPLAYKSDENYIKTLALYRKSWHLEQGTTHFIACLH